MVSKVCWNQWVKKKKKFQNCLLIAVESALLMKDEFLTIANNNSDNLPVAAICNTEQWIC